VLVTSLWCAASGGALNTPPTHGSRPASCDTNRASSVAKVRLPRGNKRACLEAATVRKPRADHVQPVCGRGPDVRRTAAVGRSSTDRFRKKGGGGVGGGAGKVRRDVRDCVRGSGGWIGLCCCFEQSIFPEDEDSSARACLCVSQEKKTRYFFKPIRIDGGMIEPTNKRSHTDTCEICVIKTRRLSWEMALTLRNQARTLLSFLARSLI
jgi:hypothetical protein